MMRKFLVTALMVALFGSMSLPVPVVAQTAGAIGSPVPFYSVDGNQIGTITINEVVDPFEEFDTYYEPQRGYHYVAIDLTVANGSQRPIEVDPYDLVMVDSDGFVSNGSSMSLNSESTATLLEYTDALAPGTEASGLVVFEAFSGTSISRILFSPNFDVTTTIADLRTEQVAAGTPVSIVGSSGSEIARVTINGVGDPFDAYDDYSAPPRGSRYVAVDVTVANLSNSTLSTSPSSFYATDDLGFLLDQPWVTTTDPGLVSFDYLDLAPGEEQRGLVYFQVLEGIPIVQIVYGDGYSRSSVVADLALGAPALAAQPTAVPVPSSPDCEGLVAWGSGLLTRLLSANALIATFEDVEPADLDPVALREASAQFETLAQETRDSNPPVAAVALNTFFADQFFEVLADATEQIAIALENNDPASAQVAIDMAETAMAAFEGEGEASVLLEQLETACPNEIDQLNNL
ncbi:MAG: DUF4352 domain-containing protein [Thermomicrobiales bacterium]|nr:DUF4352 domain-containing protein [Thermomicrobiales bacterium]